MRLLSMRTARSSTELAKRLAGSVPVIHTHDTLRETTQGPTADTIVEQLYVCECFGRLQVSVTLGIRGEKQRLQMLPEVALKVAIG